MSNELDKHFGEQLRGYESELDAEALWQAVQPPRRPRRAWWFLLLLLLLIGSTAYWWMSREGEEPATMEILPSTATVDAPVESVAGSLERPGTDQHSAESPTEPAAVEDGRTEALSQAPNQAKGSAAAGQTPTTSPTLEVPATLTVREELPGRSESVSADERSRQTGPEERLPQHSSEESEAVTRSANQWREDGQAAATRVDALPLSLSLLASSPRTLDKVPDCGLFSRRKTGTGLFIGLEGGYFATDRTLTTTDSTATSAWVDTRQLSESALDAVSSQLTVGYQHARGWRLRGGLAFTQLTNVFEWSATQTTVDTVEGVQRIIIGPGGDSTLVQGPVASFQTSAYFKRTYNRMQQWEVPLLLGYRLQGGDWSLVVEAGPRLLLQRQWSGEVLNPEMEVADWNQALAYRSTLSLQSVDVGVQLAYRLAPQLDLGLGLWGRFPTQDFSLEDGGQGERYRLLGAQLGLFYRL